MVSQAELAKFVPHLYLICKMLLDTVANDLVIFQELGLLPNRTPELPNSSVGGGFLGGAGLQAIDVSSPLQVDADSLSSVSKR